jgi:uncharacterized protein YabN with tetrapyrrole methylase and pyrophosphatase domain
MSAPLQCRREDGKGKDYWVISHNRFAYVEQGAKKPGRNLSDMTLEEMDALWLEAKQRD